MLIAIMILYFKIILCGASMHDLSVMSMLEVSIRSWPQSERYDGLGKHTAFYSMTRMREQSAIEWQDRMAGMTGTRCVTKFHTTS